MLQRKFALIKRKLESYSIDDLTDVSLGTPSNGDILVWNGSSFVTGTHGDIGGLADDDHPQYAGIAQSETISGAWTFTGNVTFNTGDVTLAGPTYVTYGYLEIKSAGYAGLWFWNSSAAANEGWFGIDTTGSGNEVAIRTTNDSGPYVYKNVLAWTRSGNALSTITYGNSTDNPGHTFRGYPIFHSAGMDIRSTNGWGIYLQDASAAVDTEWWSIESIGGTGTWRLFASNDAFSTERDALSFARTAGAVTSQTYGNSTDNPTHQFHGEVRLGTDQPLRFDEHSSAAGTPATGNVYLYAKADGLLYSKDDAGTETLVSGGSGGSANFDDILTAGGEVLVDGSGNVMTI